MKRLVLIAFCAISVVVAGTAFADDNTYADDIYATDGVTAVKKAKDKKERKREQEVQDSIEYEQARQAVEDGHFVVTADQIRGRYGRTVYVNSTTNFVLVQGDTAVVQFAIDGVMHSPNGIGGITVKGRVTKKDIKYDKKGNLNCSFYVNGTALAADITFSLTKGTSRCSATVSSNFSGERLTFTGYLHPYDMTGIYKGWTID